MFDIKTVSVFQINAYVKKLIDSNGVLSNFWIRGEISNYKRHYSGHLYITLKDETSVLKAVMFKSSTSSLTFEPKDGMMIIARGKLSVYEPSGAYQFYIEEMIQSGIGDLQAKFEKLKNRLSEEGLFDEKLKKPIPAMPSKIGVCTATTGAAVRDIINVVSRRFPYSEIIIYPTIVQGEDAADSIVAAIEWFNENNAADVLIVGRGGGSIEDLWAFNEEKVAYGIYNSNIPIISAVGHETDFTIADFVADMRAPTPSAAAELAVPSASELYSRINIYENKIIKNLTDKIEYLRLKTDKLTPAAPRDVIREFSMKRQFLQKRLKATFNNRFSDNCNKFSKLTGTLNSLSPLAVMSRGYAIATNKNGEMYKSVSDLKLGKKFTLRLHDGCRECIVDE